MKYWLRIPTHKYRRAMQSGCKYDVERKQWYVEEPLRPGFLIEDFLNWMESPTQVNHAKDQRAKRGL